MLIFIKGILWCTSSDVSRDTEPYWEHDKFNNEKMKWKIVYRDEQLVKTTSARLAISYGSKILSSTLQLELSDMMALSIPDI